MNSKRAGNVFGDLSRAEILRRVGDISQVCGARRVELVEGMERGVEAVEVSTGGGLNFTVLPGRGMDIARAEFRGVPLAWRSGTGDVAPAYFDPAGLGWLRSFGGGLVTTCGYTWAGAPCVDQGVALGLHGRASNLAASEVWAGGEWVGDEYLVTVRGAMREAMVFGENLRVTRRITARLGEARIEWEDRVENLGQIPTEHMMLYHCNLGYPLVGERAVLRVPGERVEPRDAVAEPGLGEWMRFGPPVAGMDEQVYYHDACPDDSGIVTVQLENPECAGHGFGVRLSLSYRKAELPEFVQWKMPRAGMYVLGLEPANCRVGGRAKERERGALVKLAPGETRTYWLEMRLEALG